MIGREHDAVTRVEGGAETFHAVTFDAYDAVTFSEVERKQWAKKMPPQLAALRRDEAVGFRDNDVLHPACSVGAGISASSGRRIVAAAAPDARWAAVTSFY